MKEIEYFMKAAPNIRNPKTIFFNIDKNEFVTGKADFELKIINKKWNWKDGYKLLRYDNSIDLFLYHTEEIPEDTLNYFQLAPGDFNKFYNSVKNYYGYRKYINSFMEVSEVTIPIETGPNRVITFKVNRKILDDNNIFKESIDNSYDWKYDTKLYDWLNQKSYLELVKPEQEDFEYYLVGFRYFDDRLINDLNKVSYNYVIETAKFLKKYCISCGLNSVKVFSDDAILWLLVPKQVFERTENGLIVYEANKNILVPNTELFEYE